MGVVVPGVVLERSFYERDPQVVAPELLNKVLVHKGASGRIVEVEAYDGGNDPASHAFRGQTARNAVMFGPAGHLYVYFTYGMHFCCNVVCAGEGRAAAVLVRALAPLDGITLMRDRRGKAGADLYQLTSGPAKLCQALAIDRSQDGVDITVEQSALLVLDDSTRPPKNPSRGSRIGIKNGLEHKWRWWVSGDPNVTRQ